jgi:histone H3/H4
MKEGDNKNGTLGMISIGRTSCGGRGAALNGSSILHREIINMEIYTAVERDEYGISEQAFQDKLLMRIEMTPVQFAEMISVGMNTSGSVCTLRSFNGKSLQRPELDDKTLKHFRKADKSKDELLDRVSNLANEVTNLVNSKKISKKSAEALMKCVNSITIEVGSNAEFRLNTFKETMDSIVCDSKAEYDAFVEGKIRRIALETIGDKVEEFKSELMVHPQSKPIEVGAK